MNICDVFAAEMSVHPDLSGPPSKAGQGGKIPPVEQLSQGWTWIRRQNSGFDAAVGGLRCSGSNTIRRLSGRLCARTRSGWDILGWPVHRGPRAPAARHLDRPLKLLIG